MKKVYLLSYLVLATVAASAAGPDTKYKAPRTGDGQPDLQGVWNFSSDVTLERPAKFAEKKIATREEIDQQRRAKENALKMIGTFAPVEDIGVTLLDHASHVEDLRTSLITYPENGRLPTLVEGVTRAAGAEQIIEALSDLKGGLPPELSAFLAPQSHDSYQNFSAAERCLIGAPSAPFIPDLDGNYVHIIQSKSSIAFLSDTDRRIAPLDGRPALSGRLRTWSGDARARWEGDTLVVETRNFNNRTRSFSGAGFSASKVVTERFTRRSPKVLDYEATVVDPATFVDKVVIGVPMALVDGHVYENACHEHNYSLANALSAARKEEQVKR